MSREVKTTFLSAGMRGAAAVLMLALAGCATTGGGESATEPAVTTAKDAVNAGDEAARRGDFQQALSHYVRAVGIEETADTWFRIGAAASRLDKSERALVAFSKVIELDPLRAAAHEGAGLEHLALGNDAPARERLSKALELDPRLWRAHNGLGILADRAGDHGTATEHYSAALAINPKSPMLLNNIGYSRYLAGELDQAARDFYAVTQLSPDYKAAWSNLGMVYAQRGWYAEAVRVLSRTMEKAEAHNHVGYVAYRNGDFVESEFLLREAVRLSPTYYQAAQQNLELVRTKLGNDEG